LIREKKTLNFVKIREFFVKLLYKLLNNRHVLFAEAEDLPIPIGMVDWLFVFIVV